MKRPSSYNTKQRQAVLDHILSLGNAPVTATQMVGYFENEEPPVGRTTVYRHLEKLVQEGKLCKYNVDGITGACYQYVNDNDGRQEQLLLKCEGCGELIHLNCDALAEIHRHIYQDHTFKVNPAKTIFHGKCEDCFRSK